MRLPVFFLLFFLSASGWCQVTRTLGPLTEVFAWKQITFNIQGTMLLQDRFGEVDESVDVTREEARRKRQSDIVFDNNDDPNRYWNTQNSSTGGWRDITSNDTSSFNNNNAWNNQSSNNNFGNSGNNNSDNNWNSNSGDSSNRNSGTSWNDNSGDTWNNNSGIGWNSSSSTSGNNDADNRWNNNPGNSWNNQTGDTLNNNWNNIAGNTWNNNSSNSWNNNAGGGNNNQRSSTSTTSTTLPPRVIWDNNNRRPSNGNNNGWNRPSTTTARPSDESRRFFIQYNNLPMGVERVGDRLFVTVPRRRYGIPSTLNYLSLTEDRNTRSPSLRPYPSPRDSRALTSVYRTRADECNRLWMVDTGLLEIPDNRQQVQAPAIVIYDLNTDRQILRYSFKSSDIPSDITPTGLASITIDIPDGDCSNAYAYVPDLATNGLIVYSLREHDSWRLSHNYFHFNPLVGNLQIAGQRFQWSDGIFSITLGRREVCRNAYFHAMVGTHEFAVSTCNLRNRTASTDSNFWTLFSVVGNRGANSQSTMHGYHAGSNVMFFADIARSAISCWNTANPLTSANVGILVSDSARLSYPSDLHVTGDEVWIMANSLPTWAYSTLDTDSYNFYIYRATVQDLIRNSVCETRDTFFRNRNGMAEENEATES